MTVAPISIATPPVPSREIASRLQAIGREISVAPNQALYAALHSAESSSGVVVVRDLHYAPHQRNRLDVFAPQVRAAGPLPVLLFVHGGGYVGGDKHSPDSPFYSNIGLWAARNGMVGVNMTYRLAPDAPWPAAQVDIAQALQWVRDHIAGHQGDPQRIYLMGHSAGASHAASYLADTSLHPGGGPGVAGAILVCGLYEYEAFAPTEGFRHYHGTDASAYARRSPMSALLSSPVPMLFAVAENDLPDYNAQADVMIEALVRTGSANRFLTLTGHNHLSLVYAVNTEDTGLTDEIRAFVGRTR